MKHIKTVAQWIGSQLLLALVLASLTAIVVEKRAHTAGQREILAAIAEMDMHCITAPSKSDPRETVWTCGPSNERGGQ